MDRKTAAEILKLSANFISWNRPEDIPYVDDNDLISIEGHFSLEELEALLFFIHAKINSPSYVKKKVAAYVPQFPENHQCEDEQCPCKVGSDHADGDGHDQRERSDEGSNENRDCGILEHGLSYDIDLQSGN